MSERYSTQILSEHDRRIWQRLSLRHGASFLEIAQIIREEILSRADPLYQGEADRKPNAPNLAIVGFDYFAKRKVPAPDANVDVLIAFDQASHDQTIATYLLDQRPSLHTLIEIVRNQLSWSRFFAVRSPLPEDRERHATFAEDIEGYLAKLDARIKAKLRIAGGNDVGA